MDLLKLTDTIELIPRLDPELVSNILLAAFDHWSTSTDFIDTNSAGQRSKLNLHRGDLSKAFSLRFDREEPIEAFTTLLATPRAVKHLVSQVDEIWRALRGEVRLSDVIVLTALRFGAGDVLDFLIKNLDAARERPDKGLEGLVPANAEGRVRSEWNAFLERRDDERQVQTLVDLLGIEQLKSERVVSSEGPQDASQFFPTDYVRRILAKRLAAGEVRDQTVLADIEAWKNSDPRLAERLVRPPNSDERYLSVWEHFSRRHSDEELLPLADRVIELLLERDGKLTVGDDPAIIAVWRNTHSRVGREHAGWVRQQIQRAMPISLVFATEFFYFWTGQYGIVEENERQSLARDLQNAAREVIRDTQTLVALLKNDKPFVLAAIVAKTSQTGLPFFDGWEWLSPILLVAGREYPDLVLPEIASLIQTEHSGYTAVKEGPAHYIHPFAIDERRLERVFDGSSIEVVSLFTSYKGTNSYVLRTADASRKWFENNLSS